MATLEEVPSDAAETTSDGTVNTVYISQEGDAEIADLTTEQNKQEEEQPNKSLVTDGQPVQLEDGSMAYLHTTAREGAQAIQLEDGTTAYISHAPTEDMWKQSQDAAKQMDITNDENQINKELSSENAAGVVRVIQLGEKAFRCAFEGCGRLYTTQHHLKVHERSHTGDKPFRCEYTNCGKAFATGYGLKSHTRVHTGEKPYKCPEENCEKAFKTSGDLQKHIRIHTGERPFRCPFEGCDRAFTTSNIRKVHIRTHTGERPYVCQEDGCGRTFASATNYKNHIRIHTGEKPYVCTVEGCNKRFTEYSSLYKHHVVHTHSKPYVCNHCGKTYRQTSTLAMHKRTAHNEETTSEMEALSQCQVGITSAAGLSIGVRQHTDLQEESAEGTLVINTSDAQQVVANTGVSVMTGDQALAALQGAQLQSGQVVTVNAGEQGEQIYVVTDPSQLLQLGLQVEQQQVTTEEQHQVLPAEEQQQSLTIDDKSAGAARSDLKLE